jgi:hypothetical protein
VYLLFLCFQPGHFLLREVQCSHKLGGAEAQLHSLLLMAASSQNPPLPRIDKKILKGSLVILRAIAIGPLVLVYFHNIYQFNRVHRLSAGNKSDELWK